MATQMKAAVIYQAGGPEVLKLEEVSVPMIVHLAAIVLDYKIADARKTATNSYRR